MEITKEKNQCTISRDSVNFIANSSDFAKNFLYHIISVGHFFTSKNFITSRQDNDFNSFLLLYIVKGEMKLTLDDVYYAYDKNIMIVDCYNKHHYEALSDCEFYYIHFDGCNARSFANIIINSLSHVFSNDTYFDKHIKIINDLIQKLVNNETLEESFVSIQIHTILCQLTKNLSSNYKIKYSKYVQEALQFIQNNYMHHINIDDIARAVGISSQHLNRLFKSEINQSPYNYLLSIRMNYSIKLLCYTDYNIDEISSLIGFSSSYNYMNAFKKQFNLTPSQFRHEYIKVSSLIDFSSSYSFINAFKKQFNKNDEKQDN